MTGPWPHPKTGILYYRKATPPDIFSQRRRLSELGVMVTREVQRSLGTRDRKPAERFYKEVSGEIEAEWDRWRALLRDGPQVLSERQQMAIAGEHAKAFLAANEENPFQAPPEATIPQPADSGNSAWVAMVERMAPAEREALTADLKEFLRAKEDRRLVLAFRLLTKHPALKVVLGPDLAAALEVMHGADTDEALAARKLHVDAATRRLVNLEMAGFMGVAQRGLEARRGGDYSPVKELGAAPSFVASRPSALPNGPDGGLSLEGLLTHKAKTTSIRPKTVTDNRSYLRKFITFIGHGDARKVTKDDVRRWRDSLGADGKLSPKTITDRYLSAVRAVLSHGVKEFDLPFNAASGISDNRAPAAPQGPKGYSEAEAVKILKATFIGSSKALSAPHGRALFWIPWVLAYTGLRVTEAAQLQGKRLLEEDGIPYLLITPEDGSTKSGKAWAVGIHKHLIELGLLEMLKANGPGPVFYEPYPKGTDLTAIDGKHRALEAGGRVADWITGEVGIKAPLRRPNHAWRHLFTTRSRPCGMDKEARDFMMGSRSGADAREGYGDWPPAVLDREINKLPRFEVEDTGWRP
jgi:integrase